MFRAMLSLQWKWSRVTVLLLAAVATLLPIWTFTGSILPGGGGPINLSWLQTTSAWYRILAIAAGFLLAMHAWRKEHEGRHVYALSLPIPRWRYVLHRYAAGALFGMLVLVAFWLSALMTAGLAPIPAGLRAYPSGLTLRVGFAFLAAYAFFFGVWSVTRRAGYYTAGVLLGGFVLVQIPVAMGTTAVTDALSWLWRIAGLGMIFGGRWFLIDV